MGEWSGRLGGRKGGRERAELAGTAGWGWWLKAEETRGGGGGVRVGFLAWHRGIDTPVGAQRHQRLRRPTSLHLDDRTKPLFPILHFLFPPSVELLHLESGTRNREPSSSLHLPPERVFIARIFPSISLPPRRSTTRILGQIYSDTR